MGGPDDVDQALVAEPAQPLQAGRPGDQVVDLVQLDPAVGVAQRETDDDLVPILDLGALGDRIT